MPADAKAPGGFSLRRWSRRKQDAVRPAVPAAARPPVLPVKALDTTVPVAPPSATPAMPDPKIPSALPPVESLTPDSDFTAFLQPKVDEALKRQALKKLFADPRFNVMDGLDVYIDDYTKTVPIPPDILEQLMSGFSFNPPPVAGEGPQEPAPNASVEAAPQALAVSNGVTPEQGTKGVPPFANDVLPASPALPSRRTDITRDSPGAPDPPDLKASQ